MGIKKFHIAKINTSLRSDLQRKIDFKTKPLGALGKLEQIALKVGLIQGTLSPEFKNPHIIVFAGDHGIANEGVSAYPQEVTFQMVMNFLQGGAAINVFCKQHDIQLKVVDAGVNFDFPDTGQQLINAKIAKGTNSFLKIAAMTAAQQDQAIVNGAGIIKQLHTNGCNVVGFGEMGIGNTSSASVLMSLYCNLPLEECVGRGAGLTDDQFLVKVAVLKQAIENHRDSINTGNYLQYFGGFEIAMMCGAMLQAAELKMVILVDGFISSAAFLAAHAINPNVLEYALFCHQSDENGHKKMLLWLDAHPVLNLNMRLGEGTGAAIAYPVIKSALEFLNNMASFESAGVSNKN